MSSYRRNGPEVDESLRPEDARYWLSLAKASGIGPRRFVRLIESAGSAEAVYGLTAAEVSRVAGVPTHVAGALLRAVPGADEDAIMAVMERAGIRLVTYRCPEYPPLLKSIHDFPPFLFVRGTPLSCLRGAAGGLPWVAVVGTRRPTAYGRSVATALARDLCLAGLVVVSGLASGIDSCAHRGALDAGGATVAVLGTGVDVAYPRQNAGMLESICRTGAVVSEYLPGSGPEPWRFPARNRVISGMCEATVVVEAGERSGALITADFALEQGREVLAVPGQAGAAMSRGTNGLIKSGAALVEDARDVLDALGLQNAMRVASSPAAGSLQGGLEEGAVMNSLAGGPLSAGEISDGTGIGLPAVMAVLTRLEVRGLVCRLPGGVYCRRR